VASSPVSQAAWRVCIDNIPACKAQSIPWGAQQKVDEESLDGLFAPQLDIAAEQEIWTPLKAGTGMHRHTQTGTLPELFPHTSFILILSLPSHTHCRTRAREQWSHGRRGDVWGGDGERMTAGIEDRPHFLSPIRSANPASRGADHHSHLPAPLHLVRGQMWEKVTSCCTSITGLVPSQ